jgi:hypothetical protein
MRLRCICTESTGLLPFTIEHVDEEWGDPMWFTQAEALAEGSGIGISRHKNLGFVALDGDGDVVGAVWHMWYKDEDQNAEVYDFDIAVDRPYQWGARVFLQLVEAAIEEYRARDELRSYIRVWVINPRLVGVLERKFGFEVESEHGDGSTHMTYYGQ